MTNREKRHVATLRKRRDFLRERVASSTDHVLSYDRAEAAALTWAILILEAADQEGVVDDIRELIPR